MKIRVHYFSLNFVSNTQIALIVESFETDSEFEIDLVNSNQNQYSK